MFTMPHEPTSRVTSQFFHFDAAVSNKNSAYDDSIIRYYRGSKNNQQFKENTV
jgi:hypothetical protein